VVHLLTGWLLVHPFPRADEDQVAAPVAATVEAFGSRSP
jgi:hypothetical protein